MEHLTDDFRFRLDYLSAAVEAIDLAARWPSHGLVQDLGFSVSGGCPVTCLDCIYFSAPRRSVFCGKLLVTARMFNSGINDSVGPGAVRRVI